MNKTQIISFFLTPLVKIWASTFKYRQINFYNYFDLKKQGQKVIFSIWHGELFPLIYLHQKEKIIALVSPSKDGELIAQVLFRFGFSLARGSSSRSGVRALVALIRKFKKDPQDIVITVDGPRGPRHQVKEGIFYLAYKLNLPILPVRVKLSNKYVFKKSWDKFYLPLPFSQCQVVYGEPFWIKDLSKNNIAIYKNKLENTMRELYGKFDN